LSLTLLHPLQYLWWSSSRSSSIRFRFPVPITVRAYEEYTELGFDFEDKGPPPRTLGASLPLQRFAALRLAVCNSVVSRGYGI
jgi:hypothetical protein